jgi:FHA domain
VKVKVLNSETQGKIKEFEFALVFAKEDICSIGRSQNSGLVLDSRDVSRLHGKFFRQEGQYYFSDLGSSNGSTINGKPAVVNQDYSLKPGDIIKIGEFVLTMEATYEEELPGTIIGDLEATVISGKRSPSVSKRELPANVETPASEAPEVVSQASDEVIKAELAREIPGALVKVETTRDNADDPENPTIALFAAINKRALGEIRAAGTLTREAYLNAIRRTRESIEHNQLIDPEQIEKEAEKYWQSVVKGTTTLSSRLGAAAVKGVSEVGTRLASAATKGASEAGIRLSAAAKAAFSAAWREIRTPRSDSANNLNQLGTKVVSEAPEIVVQALEEDVVPKVATVQVPEEEIQVPDDQLLQSDAENKPSQTSLEGKLIQSNPENRLRE